MNFINSFLEALVEVHTNFVITSGEEFPAMYTFLVLYPFTYLGA